MSAAIQRQVGVLMDRRGHVQVLLVGDSKSVFIPPLTEHRRGRDRLSGLRLIHTHLLGEPLTDDDLTDLALLRLDLVAAIEVLPDGLPGRVYSAHLKPDSSDGNAYEVAVARSVHELTDDFIEQITALEDEFARNRSDAGVVAPAGGPRGGIRAILVHVGQSPASQAADSLEELGELSRSAGIVEVARLTQRRAIDPKYVMGQGRLQDTVIKAMQLGADALVFDLNLTPAQVSTLANYTDLKILDRTQVILDIFGQNALTREGRIQVELAQLRYLLPRLSEKHTAMSRLTGGIGGRGPGETKLEIDRRRVQDRISQLEREVDKLGDRRKLRRNVRTQRGLPTVSIVGYTNAGKSTLLNHLTQSDVVAENKLFATLNPVSRRLRFPHEREIIITDTVGFIRNLPKDLFAAFRTTLEELDEAGLLLHVLDASRPDIDDLYETVRNVLNDLGLAEKKTLVVLNKADLCDPEELRGLCARYQGVPVSAIDRASFGPLMDAMESALWAEQALAQ